MIDDAYTPNYYAYNVAFVNQDVGCGRIAFLLGIVIAVVAYVVQFSSQRRQRP